MKQSTAPPPRPSRAPFPIRPVRCRGRSVVRCMVVLLVLLMSAAACAGGDDAGDSSESVEAATPATSQDATAEAEPPATPAEPTAEPEPTATPTATEPTTEPEPTATPTATEPTTEPEPERQPFAPIGAGEYRVGVQTITITDPERDRPLTVEVWFPVGDDAPGDPHRYTFITGDYYESPRAISAAADDLSADGPFPLVVYSHGSGGQRYLASDYAETISSHGYIVVAPDHTGNTAIERVAGVVVDRDRVALDRPLDVIAVIDAMTADGDGGDGGDPEDDAARFAGSVDAEKIAVTGHSFGGFTAYAVAAGYANDLGSSPPDDRVDAIIPLAPAVGDGVSDGTLLSDGRLIAVTVPQLVMVGTDDKTTPVDPNVTRAFDLTRSAPLYRVDLVAAEHQSFTDVCDYLDFFPTLDPPVSDLVLGTIEEVAVEGCSPDDMDIQRVKELTNTFAVRFLDSIFFDTPMITDDNITIPDDVRFASKAE